MADIPARQFNLSNVNAGYYNVPQLDLADQVLHVGDAATTVTPTLTNPVDPTNPVVNYAIQTGAPTDLVSVNGSGAVSGTLTPQKTGVTTLLLTTDDGYGDLIKKEVKLTVWADVKYDGNGADSGSISANGEQLYPSTTLPVRMHTRMRRRRRVPRERRAWIPSSRARVTTSTAGTRSRTARAPRMRRVLRLRPARLTVT